jgi:hypothetical protein
MIDGTQAEYVRVPFADTSTYKVPAGATDEEISSASTPDSAELDMNFDGTSSRSARCKMSGARCRRWRLGDAGRRRPEVVSPDRAGRSALNRVNCGRDPYNMRLNVVHPGKPTQIGVRRSSAATQTPRQTAESEIHVQATIWSGRACCCPARPAVLVIMPPTAGRPQPTELLLCWEHYRASQRSPAAARSTAHLSDSTPATEIPWPSKVTA